MWSNVGDRWSPHGRKDTNCIAFFFFFFFYFWMAGKSAMGSLIFRPFTLMSWNCSLPQIPTHLNLVSSNCPFQWVKEYTYDRSICCSTSELLFLARACRNYAVQFPAVEYLVCPATHLGVFFDQSHLYFSTLHLIVLKSFPGHRTRHLQYIITPLFVGHDMPFYHIILPHLWGSARKFNRLAKILSWNMTKSCLFFNSLPCGPHQCYNTWIPLVKKSSTVDMTSTQKLFCQSSNKFYIIRCIRPNVTIEIYFIITYTSF